MTILTFKRASVSKLFFSFQISSRTITWSLSLGARQVRMPRSIPIHFLYPAELFHAYRSFDISLTPGGDSEWDVIWPIRSTQSDSLYQMTLDLELTNLTRFSHPTRGADTFKIVNLINALSSIWTWLFDTFVNLILTSRTIKTVRTDTFKSQLTIRSTRTTILTDIWLDTGVISNFAMSS